MNAPADAQAPAEIAAVRRARRWRLALVELLQLLPLLLLVATQSSAALWTAGLLGSAICCAGTDSGWRWLNRLLVLQAVLWLLVPLVFAGVGGSTG